MQLHLELKTHYVFHYCSECPVPRPFRVCSICYALKEQHETDSSVYEVENRL